MAVFIVFTPSCASPLGHQLQIIYQAPPACPREYVILAASRSLLCNEAPAQALNTSVIIPEYTRLRRRDV